MRPLKDAVFVSRLNYSEIGCVFPSIGHHVNCKFCFTGWINVTFRGHKKFLWKGNVNVFLCIKLINTIKISCIASTGVYGEFQLETKTEVVFKGDQLGTLQRIQQRRHRHRYFTYAHGHNKYWDDRCIPPRVSAVPCKSHTTWVNQMITLSLWIISIYLWD